MGTWIGHVAPSIIFMSLSIWWGFVTAIKFARTQKNPKLKFTGGISMPTFFLSKLRCLPRAIRVFPFEALFKILFLSIHFSIELFGGMHRKFLPDDDQKIILGPDLVLEPENFHHVCMLSGFMVAAVIEILVHLGVPFPYKTPYMFNLLGFFIMTYTMTTHLGVDTGLEYDVHFLWFVCSFGSLIAVCLETYNSNNLWAIYMRIFFFFAQGTWLMQIAFEVWPSSKPAAVNSMQHSHSSMSHHESSNSMAMEHTNHHQKMILNLSLMFHFIGIACFLMIQYLFVYFTLGLYQRSYDMYESDLNGRLNLNSENELYEKRNGKEYSLLLENENANEIEIE